MKNNETNKSSDILSFLSEQQNGLLVGSFVTFFLSLIDQRLAAYFARKNNIKQKELTKLLFPSLICLIQLILRKRSKESKLADILSMFKSSPPQATPNRANNNTVPSTPRSVSHLNHDSVSDDVFDSKAKNTHAMKPKSKRAQSAKFRKNSTIAIPITSTPKTK